MMSTVMMMKIRAHNRSIGWSFLAACTVENFVDWRKPPILYKELGVNDCIVNNADILSILIRGTL